jgi:prepilin-type N-terminal cleavage/methylation domain-containing protein
MKRLSSQKGFTLIELLVVIAIIALLSTLAVVSLNSAREKSRDAKRLSDVRQIQTALELYYDDQKAYPAANLTFNGQCLTNGGFQNRENCNQPGATMYMGFVPGDPLNSAPNTYAYTSTQTSDYEIRFQLENPTAGLPGDSALCASTIGLIPCTN